MKSNYTVISQHPFNASTSYILPAMHAARKVSRNSPALQVMTDLEKVVTVTTGPDVNIDTANQQMITNKVRLLLVTDEQRHVLGLITANDILGERPMKHLQQMGGKHADILVRHIMTSWEQLDSLDIKDVANAKVGDIVATLTDLGRQHALVVTIEPNGARSICGIFSSTQISRQLGEVIEISNKAKTFSEIEAALSA